ncbi:MAG: hypothetical protein M3Y39_10575 [Chloroflexota bacterium]|nr:hypothetical protein [Chloroflexota bacterium]
MSVAAIDLHQFAMRAALDEFRKITGGVGCIFGPALLISLITVLVAGILVAIAIPIGAATGIKKYTDARQLAANGSQKLVALQNTAVQRGSGN